MNSSGEKFKKFLFVLFGFCSINLAIAQTLIQGTERNGYFHPKPQIWKISKFRLASDTQKDLRGLPVILGSTPFIFGENFYAYMDPNSGGMMTIGACFKKVSGGYLAIPQGRFRKAASESTFLEEAPNLKYTLGTKFNLTLTYTEEVLEKERYSKYQETVEKVKLNYNFEFECI